MLHQETKIQLLEILKNVDAARAAAAWLEEGSPVSKAVATSSPFKSNAIVRLVSRREMGPDLAGVGVWQYVFSGHLWEAVGELQAGPFHIHTFSICTRVVLPYWNKDAAIGASVTEEEGHYVLSLGQYGCFPISFPKA